MSNKPLVSVVITTKNEQLHIANCLLSIRQGSYKNVEIIVVDNKSTDATKEIARSFTDLVFDKGPERSAQRNFGIKKAKGEFVFFVDADMIFTKNVIYECVNKFKKDKKNTLGGIIIPERSIGEGYWTQVKAFERSLYEGEATIEAARFFKKDILLEMDGYDERITGPEDWDLPQRVKQRYQIARIKSFILHDEGKLSIINLVKKKYYYGLKVPQYLNNDHPVALTAQQVVYLLRPAFYKNWKLLARNPQITSGMIVMLFAEQMAGFVGFANGMLKKRKK